jgi:succinyl-CoA synthetase beta subunit
MIIRSAHRIGGAYTRRALPQINHIGYQQKRFFDLQEYQSKQILHQHGVQVQRFKVVSSMDEARQVLYPENHGHDKVAAASSLSGPLDNDTKQSPIAVQSKWSGFDTDISVSNEFVVKAQVLAGGRGKGYFKGSKLRGGVQLTRDRHAALNYVESMLQDHLVTKQTSSDGVLVHKVMIADAVRLKREFYFAIVLDRSYDIGPIFVASPSGGMDIEDVAAKDPEAIRRFTIPIDMELDFDTTRKIVMVAFDLNQQDLNVIDQAAREIQKLHKLFLELDATQVEINPLGITTNEKVICVDAKIKFDENARFRHKWLDELEQMNAAEMDKRDCEARKHQLNFIGLDGSIGCLVNGAGLAMATMDIIKLHGGEPANFLDVGGGASVRQVLEAFKIITSDKNVRTIFVNIFGGIMRCDTIAEGIIEAAKLLKLNTPIVCRLQGSKVNEARSLIESSRLPIRMLDDLDEAASLAVDIATK